MNSRINRRWTQMDADGRGCETAFSIGDVMNFERRVELYADGVLTRPELIAAFIDCIAEQPKLAAEYYAILPSEFAPEVHQLAASSDADWISSFYPRGIAPIKQTTSIPNDYSAEKYALTTLRAIQSLFP